LAIGHDAAEVLSSSFAARLPNPIGAFSLLVTVGKASINDLLEIAKAEPYAFVRRLFNSELNLVFEGIQRRLNNCDVVAVYLG
jgi:hypothetical protein